MKSLNEEITPEDLRSNLTRKNEAKTKKLLEVCDRIITILICKVEAVAVLQFFIYKAKIIKETQNSSRSLSAQQAI